MYSVKMYFYSICRCLRYVSIVLCVQTSNVETSTKTRCSPCNELCCVQCKTPSYTVENRSVHSAALCTPKRFTRNRSVLSATNYNILHTLHLLLIEASPSNICLHTTIDLHCIERLIKEYVNTGMSKA
jgi:hypothetical protein